MLVTNTDATLWYDVGVFGREGFAVPAFSDDMGTLNPQIWDLVTNTGRNLQHIMLHEDVALRVPPSINTLMRLHKLYVRASQILAGRAVPPNEPNMETSHVNPAGEVFLVFPCPYFKARNVQLKRWASYIFVALAEMIQHTENRKAMEISTGFAGSIGQWFSRYYREMSIECFGKTREDAWEPGFLLTDADFAGYDPTKFFTSTEMIDTVPRLDRQFTEDEMAPLSAGIPISSLPVLQPWPTNVKNLYTHLRHSDVDANDDAFTSQPHPESTEGTGPATDGRQQPQVPKGGDEGVGAKAANVEGNSGMMMPPPPSP